MDFIVRTRARRREELGDEGGHISSTTPATWGILIRTGFQVPPALGLDDQDP